MHPGAVPGAGGWVTKEVRAAARANIVLGLALAAMALVAATANPGDLHVQPLDSSISDVSPAPAPVAQAQQCAATEEEAQDMRGTALLLVLMGLGQAVVALAADVALSGLLHVGGLLTALAHVSGALNVCFLCYVVSQMAVLTIGHCALGQYVGELVVGYAVVAVSYAALLGVSLAVICC